ALLAFSSTPAPADDSALQETLDIRYSGGPDGQALDVFAPKGAANRPVVMVVHGGAWVYGDKDFFGLYGTVGRFFAPAAEVAASGIYRVPTRDEFNVILESMVGGLLQWSNHSPTMVALAPALLRRRDELNPFRLVFGDDHAAAMRAAPLTHVRRGLPPFLLLYA